MPSLSERRKGRILTLLTWAKTQKNITTIDPIFQKAKELYPFNTSGTIKSYAEAVLRMLKTEKKEES